MDALNGHEIGQNSETCGSTAIIKRKAALAQKREDNRKVIIFELPHNNMEDGSSKEQQFRATMRRACGENLIEAQEAGTWSDVGILTSWKE